MNDWKIFQAGKEPHDGIKELPPPPSWRKYGDHNKVMITRINAVLRFKLALKS